MAAPDNKNKETPLMKQFGQIKAKYPDAILLFRVGDFYETFGEDAIIAAQILGITLTKRHNGSASEIELAGFPYHSLDNYLPKLVKAGYRVAVCDQLEDPKLTKTIVKRGVTELVTPGIAIDDKLLDHSRNNYLVALHFDKQNIGIALADISTGEFLVAQGNPEEVDKILQSFKPSEIIYSKNKKEEAKILSIDKFYTFLIDDWVFKHDYTQEILLQHFQTQSLKGFGIDDLTVANIAAGAILHYLKDTEHPNIQHLNSIARIKQEKYVWLDKFTVRNLELIDSIHENATPLIKVIDKTISPLGSRLLKKWILLPLKDINAIEERQAVVEYFVNEPEIADLFIKQIKQIGDLERLIAKAALKRINPREIFLIKRALIAIEPIKTACLQAQNAPLNKIGEQLNACQLLVQQINNELINDPPPIAQKGGFIAPNCNPQLDEIKLFAHNSKEYLNEMQIREALETGINSLKIGFNNVFGYYLEVTNKYKDVVPKTWLRRQTLANCERYINQELKEYEDKILSAEDKILQIELNMYETLVNAVCQYIKPIQHNAALIARLDCLLCFAIIAKNFNYCKPTLNESLIIDLNQSRHPVIEQQLKLGETYIANNLYLNSEQQQILIITGPNMSGKSALLRQTALIVLMAQIGSFVPATQASIGIVDKIFTRVGASDNISSGESTFMVEMTETASIMNNISPRSLILLDEIGRGTSTYDGISIAWALAEFLHNNPLAQAKTLFATHYHELVELADQYERIKNFTIAIQEQDNKIIFLRKLITGGSQKSFGIHVAQMAGMPINIIERANEILEQLEDKHIDNKKLQQNIKKLQKQHLTNMQLRVFDNDSPELLKIKNILLKINIDTLTPVEALLKICELKKVII